MTITLTFVAALSTVLGHVHGLESQRPRFALGLQPPNVNETRGSFDFCGFGSFVNVDVADGLRIRITFRETDRKGIVVSSLEPELLTEENPAPAGQQQGIMREAKNSPKGGFLGAFSYRRYDTNFYKYEVKFEFETAKGKLISTYKQNGNRWIEIPQPNR